MNPGNHDLQPIQRGDTYPSRSITITDSDSLAIAVVSARAQIRHKDTDVVIYEWNTSGATITISGAGSNIITLGALTTGQTETFDVGNRHIYDIEITTATDTWTILKGYVDVNEDITR